ncbi:MAG: type IX secretion system sortase PorU [Paludibacteraceae bacterium]|nr:type IX secretion system sortase PorU [Paludibacteraceae bacterium]
MRKYISYIFFVLYCSLSWAGVQKYADNSVLSQGKWYKIGVQTSGLYKLSYSDIKNMGIGDPAGVRVYGYGGAIIEENLSKLLPRHDDLPEIAIYMEKGADGVFSEGDYILFYAQGTVTDNISTSGHTYTYNYYSNTGYYFITSMAGEGKRIEVEPEPTAEPTVDCTTTYAGYYIHKSEYNLADSGREWYGYKFQKSTNTQSFVIKDTDIDLTETIYLNMAVVAYSNAKTTFDVSLGGTLNKITVAGSTSLHQKGQKSTSMLYFKNTTENNPVITLKFYPNASSDAGYLHYITANYYKKLILHGNSGSLLITNPDNLGNKSVVAYHIKGCTSGTKIWNITDLNNISYVDYELDSDIATFKENHNMIHTYFAFNSSSVAKSPIMIGNVANQNLHALHNIDMVIISAPEYFEASEKLAKFHRTHDNMSVYIANPQDIYNEFSSGTPDASAYRLFMKMFYDRHQDNNNSAPQCLLFMGTASYDNLGIHHQALPLLSYQSIESLSETSSFTTDDFYAMLDDNEGGLLSSAKMDIAVGRFPVTSVTEANNVVNKTIRYVTESVADDWRSFCTFLADDGDNNTHVSQADSLTRILKNSNESFIIDKVYLDAFKSTETSSGVTFPGAKDRIHKDLLSGVLVFTYVGHGSTNTLTSEQMITKNDIVNMYNDNLGLWITASCDISRYDNNEHSAGMEAILNPKGGSVAMYTTTRIVFSSDNFKLMVATYKNLFPKDNESAKTLGEIFRLSKIDMGSNQNKLNYTLLGDPAIKLHYPTHRVVTDSINGVTPDLAVMQALGIVTIKGHIENYKGERLDDYNGSLKVVVYDKESILTTLGQTGPKFQYTDYANKLFSGTVSVENGKFSITFMVPKDIRYTNGYGKIVYYAHINSLPDNDAFGNNTEFEVYGTDPTVDPSNKGSIVRAYINVPEFENGDKVNDTPVFYAHLYDDSGINVIGSGIGHDMTLQLNNSPSKYYILNDYYTSSLNDYKSGSVRYQFPKLENGTYNLNFKSWNMQNISTVSNLTFVVDTDAKPTLEEYYIYPNPVTTELNIHLRYDRPYTPVTVTFIVYDMLWREHWETTVTDNTDGTYTAHWDLKGKYGNMASGVYWVRAKITDSNGNLTHKVQKFIIKTQ